jgi:hypothetical protein
VASTSLSLSRQKRTSSTKKKRKRRLPVFWLKIPLKDKKQQRRDVAITRGAHTPQHTRVGRATPQIMMLLLGRARRAARAKQKIAVFH